MKDRNNVKIFTTLKIARNVKNFKIASSILIFTYVKFLKKLLKLMLFYVKSS